MEIKAQTKYIRMSGRKMSLATDLIRGKKILDAENILHFLRRVSAKPLLKLLLSAVANAEHNFKLSRDNLFVKTVEVGQGPSLKRWRARAFGRAAPIRKHTCHVKLVLAEKETGVKSK